MPEREPEDPSLKGNEGEDPHGPSPDHTSGEPVRGRTERRSYGFAVIAPRTPTEAEATAWARKLREMIAGSTPGFGLLVDMRGQRTNPPATTRIVAEAMGWLRENGMGRVAIVYDSSLAMIQLRRIANDVGTVQHERYINAATTPDWETRAIAWIEHGSEPYP